MPSTEHHSLDSTLNLVDFRVAETRDIPNLVDIYRAFYEDSDLPGLGIVMSDTKTGECLRRVLYNVSPHIVAVERDDDNSRILGVLSYAEDRRGWERPYAYLDMFYVRRDWRLSGIARVLLQLAIDDAKLGGAVAFRAGISSGIGSGKNLFLKFGFRETPGSTLLARRL